MYNHPYSYYTPPLLSFLSQPLMVASLYWEKSLPLVDDSTIEKSVHGLRKHWPGLLRNGPWRSNFIGQLAQIRSIVPPDVQGVPEYADVGAPCRFGDAGIQCKWRGSSIRRQFVSYGRRFGLGRFVPSRSIWSLWAWKASAIGRIWSIANHSWRNVTLMTWIWRMPFMWHSGAEGGFRGAHQCDKYRNWCDSWRSFPHPHSRANIRIPYKHLKWV